MFDAYAQFVVFRWPGCAVTMILERRKRGPVERVSQIARPIHPVYVVGWLMRLCTACLHHDDRKVERCPSRGGDDFAKLTARGFVSRSPPLRRCLAKAASRLVT